MGVIVSKDQDRTKLQERISADLRNRTQKSRDDDDADKNLDFTEDSEYMKDTKKTGRFSWIWIVLIILAIISLIIIFLF